MTRMRHLASRSRGFAFALALLFSPLPVFAQAPAPQSPAAQPPAAQNQGTGSNAATDRGVHPNPSRMPNASEDELMRVLRQGQMPPDKVVGNVYLPDRKLAVLVQPEGRTWRDFRVSTSRWVHGILIGLAVLSILVLALVRGRDGYRPDPEGRRVLRFRPVDRFVHWLTAVSFIVLALTGLNIVFGRVLLQPWLGDAAFSAMTQWGLLAHNFTGYAFMFGILAMAVMWVQDNLFHRVDWTWFKRGGGLLTKEHIPAEKFNAGQKLIYWGAVLGGLVMAITGVLMMLPISSLGVNGMQWVQGIHTVVAGLMVALIIGHIYLGTWGVAGSFDAMARGDVDLHWARTHHPLWIERIYGRRRDRRAEPAE